MLRLPGDPAPRRPLRHRLLPAREPGAASPGSRSSASSCAATRRASSPRTCSATRARSRPTTSTTRVRGPAAGRRDRQGRRRVSPTTAVLRGVDGETRVQVDAAGQPTGGTLSEREPVPGNDLVLSIEQARPGGRRGGDRGVRAARRLRRDEHPQRPALRARLEPQLRPRRSSPSRGCPESTYKALTDADLGAPLLNRATNGLYPTGSTFKPITALAALDSGDLDLDEIINDTGAFDARRRRRDAQRGRRAYGPIALHEALAGLLRRLLLHARIPDGRGRRHPRAARSRNGRASSGSASRPASTSAARRRASSRRPNGATQLSEANTAPTRPRRGGLHRAKCELTGPRLVGRRQRQPRGRPGRPAGRSAADGGRLRGDRQRRRHRHPARRPARRGSRRPTIQEIDPPVRDHVDIDPAAQRTIMEGLHDAAMTPDGTSYAVFGDYPVQIAGKTGTAERRPSEEDQSWYMALAPYDNPKYVVAVTIERGGFGADTAAPVAKSILDQLLRRRSDDKIDGRSIATRRGWWSRWRPIAAHARTPTGPRARAWSSASGFSQLDPILLFAGARADRASASTRSASRRPRTCRATRTTTSSASRSTRWSASR